MSVRRIGIAPLPNYVTRRDPESQAILLLHGFMGSAGDWDSIIETLSRNFFCAAPDLPGHGGSTELSDEAYTMESSAQAVMGLMDELGIEKATLVGYSMGGRLALYIALRYPERCARLFLESASPGIEGEKERASRREADEERAQRLESGNLDEFLSDWYRQPLFTSLKRYEGLIEELIESRKRNDPVELAKSLRGMGTGSQPSLWGELRDLNVPTLAVSGDLDEKFARVSLRMAERNFLIHVREVPGAGHNVHLEAPGVFFSVLEDFLNQG